MTNPDLYLTMTGAALAGLAMVCMAALAGWRGWLSLKEHELATHVAGAGDDDVALPNATARIEIADLKERIRKLEAIASGVDL